MYLMLFAPQRGFLKSEVRSLQQSKALFGVGVHRAKRLSLTELLGFRR